MKHGVAIIWRVADKIEHYRARPRTENSIEQKRPDFARPWKRPLAHQLQCAAIGQLFRREWRELQRALVDPEEDKIRTCCCLPAFALKKILKVLLLPPHRRDEWKAWGKMHGNNHAGAERADDRHDKTPMTTEPMHPGF